MKLDQALNALIDVADEAEKVIYAVSTFAANSLAFEKIPPDDRYEVILACKAWQDAEADIVEKRLAFLVIRKALRRVMTNGN